MRNATLSVLLSLLACGQIFSQKDPMKWGEVPAADLAMTSYDQDPNAGAVVLCDYGTISFDIGPRGPGYRFIRHKRVKILDRSGFDEADIAVYFTADQVFSRLKAQIFAPDGTKTELEKSDFFEDKINKYLSSKKFAVPNVQVGSVIEYSYQVESGNLYSLRDWYFQTGIPTRWSELRFAMVEWFYYSNVMTGTHGLVVNESEKESKNYGGYSVLTNMNRWAAEHIPGLEDEPFNDCPENYHTKMRFQLNLVQFPGEFTEPVLDDWDKVAGMLLKHEYFGRQYLSKIYHKKLLEAAKPSISTVATPTEKAKAIFHFVNENVKWNGYYDLFVDESLSKTFESGTGYSSELNLMLLTLLIENGIEAYPVLLSTRSNGFLMTHYPLTSQFDHAVVLAKINDKDVWLDTGDPLRPFGSLAEECLNSSGLLLNHEAETYQWVDIVPERTSDVFLVNAELSPEGGLKGDLTSSHSGFSALAERKSCEKTDGKQHWQARLAGRFPDGSISEITLENQTALDQNLKAKMQLDLPSAATVNGDLIYLSPTVFSSFLESPMKAEKRVLPIEYAYPFSEQLITIIALPEGFLVDGLPEGINLALPDGAGSFQYRVSETGGKVQITSKIDLKQTFFLPEEYDGLRNFFSMIEEKMGEQIVFKKRT